MQAPAPSTIARKVIVTCAVTGGIHVPSQTPYLPITPEQIADSAIGAAEAGATILHLHARTPENGSPNADPDLYQQFVSRIDAATDAVINITTGGGQAMTLDQRLAAVRRFKPEMCSLNMGSMNFGLYPVMNRVKEFQYDWEPKYLENSRDYIFKNTFYDIEYILREIGETFGTRFEFECYDVGHLYTLAHFVDRGLIKPPFFVQTIFGILGGIGPDFEQLMHMRRTADSLFGNDYVWSVLGAGRHQMNIATMGAILGSNVRVGLEDSVYIGKGQLAESNADQVARIRRILNELSLDVATPEEARAMLNLKGKASISVA
jgi:uncharacterized protein (DUF849 family)